MNGLTHVMALAGDASAMALAAMLTLLTPNIDPIIVATALPRVAVRKTSTCTRLLCPEGLSGNVTSPAVTLGDLKITLLAVAVLIALCTAGPPDDRLL